MMWITLNFLSENVDIKDFPKMEGYKGIYLSELLKRSFWLTFTVCFDIMNVVASAIRCCLLR